MSLRSTRSLPTLLIGVQAVLLLGTAWAAYRFLVPPSVAVTAPPSPLAASAQPAPAIEDRPLSWYAPIWQRDLRRPPVDPVVERAAPKRQPRKPEPLRLSLLGTVVESDARYAVFRNGQGHIVVKRSRDEIDKFTIARIDRGRAELTRGDRTIVVKVPNYESLNLKEIR